MRKEVVYAIMCVDLDVMLYVLFVVFEYCEHDLATIVKKIKNPFTESEIKTLIHQLLSAVQYLHKTKRIIHRDIKLSNLLYNNQGQLKLADFGLARSFDDNEILTQNVVTLWYRAPEILLGSKTYTTAVDIWAIGCTFGEFLTQRPLLPGDNDIDQIHKIFYLLGCPNTRIWPDMTSLPKISHHEINLTQEQSRHKYNNIKVMMPSISEDGFNILNQLLAYDPKRRLDSSEALAHEYFYSPPYPKESELMPTFPTFHTDVGKYL